MWGELPFDADILDLAVLVLEGSQDGFDDFEAEGIVEMVVWRFLSREFMSKIACGHETKVCVCFVLEGPAMGLA
jgi:hypothetical protein